MKLYEDIVHSRLCRHLKQPGRLVFSEFPFLSRVVDTILYECDTDELVAIEIKLKNFSALLDQIHFCGHFADKTYIVIPKSKYDRTDRYRKLPKDIGVITFEPVGKKILFEYAKNPIKSRMKNERLRATAKNLLRQHFKGKICGKL